jgi:hypothetical protein
MLRWEPYAQRVPIIDKTRYRNEKTGVFYGFPSLLNICCNVISGFDRSTKKLLSSSSAFPINSSEQEGMESVRNPPLADEFRNLGMNSRNLLRNEEDPMEEGGEGGIDESVSADEEEQEYRYYPNDIEEGEEEGGEIGDEVEGGEEDELDEDSEDDDIEDENHGRHRIMPFDAPPFAFARAGRQVDKNSPFVLLRRQSLFRYGGPDEKKEKKECKRRMRKSYPRLKSTLPVELQEVLIKGVAGWQECTLCAQRFFGPPRVTKREGKP